MDAQPVQATETTVSTGPAQREDGMHFIDTPAGLTWCLVAFMLIGIAIAPWPPLTDIGKALYQGAFGAFLLKVKQK